MVDEKDIKVRLITTLTCTNTCSKCCNNYLDIDKIMTFEEWIENNSYQANNIDELILTGGDPVLYPKNIKLLIKDDSFYFTDLIIYSSVFDYKYWKTIFDMDIMEPFDGITLSIHNYAEMLNFQVLHSWFKKNNIYKQNIDFRLNIFEDVKFKSGFDFYNWRVKIVSWQDDCPVPEGEILLRLEELW